MEKAKERRRVMERGLERAKEKKDRAVMESDGAQRAKEGKGWKEEWTGVERRT